MMASRMVPLPEARTPIRTRSPSLPPGGPKNRPERVLSRVSRCAGDHGRTISAPQSAEARAARGAPGGVPERRCYGPSHEGTRATWPDRPASGTWANVARSPLPRECPS